MRGGNALGSLMSIIKTFPLDDYGFNWFVPAVVCSVVFTLISRHVQKSRIIHDTI